MAAERKIANRRKPSAADNSNPKQPAGRHVSGRTERNACSDDFIWNAMQAYARDSRSGNHASPSGKRYV